jgi:hypothetical protein
MLSLKLNSNKIMNIKTKFNLLKKLSIVYVAFWASETTFFLIRDGWHLKAVCKEEIFCDGICTFISTVLILLFVWCIVEVLNLFANCEKITIIEKIED